MEGKKKGRWKEGRKEGRKKADRRKQASKQDVREERWKEARWKEGKYAFSCLYYLQLVTHAAKKERDLLKILTAVSLGIVSVTLVAVIFGFTYLSRK